MKLYHLWGKLAILFFHFEGVFYFGCRRRGMRERAGKKEGREELESLFALNKDTTLNLNYIIL